MKEKKKKTFMERFRSFYKGEFLLNIHADEYFVHIIWVFFLAMFMIWAGSERANWSNWTGFRPSRKTCRTSGPTCSCRSGRQP